VADNTHHLKTYGITHAPFIMNEFHEFYSADFRYSRALSHAFVVSIVKSSESVGLLKERYVNGLCFSRILEKALQSSIGILSCKIRAFM
jgi:hypothetical protein